MSHRTTDFLTVSAVPKIMNQTDNTDKNTKSTNHTEAIDSHIATSLFFVDEIFHICSMDSSNSQTALLRNLVCETAGTLRKEIKLLQKVVTETTVPSTPTVSTVSAPAKSSVSDQLAQRGTLTTLSTMRKISVGHGTTPDCIRSESALPPKKRESFRGNRGHRKNVSMDTKFENILNESRKGIRKVIVEHVTPTPSEDDSLYADSYNHGAEYNPKKDPFLDNADPHLSKLDPFHPDNPDFTDEV